MVVVVETMKIVKTTKANMVDLDTVVWRLDESSPFIYERSWWQRALLQFDLSERNSINEAFVERTPVRSLLSVHGLDWRWSFTALWCVSPLRSDRNETGREHGIISVKSDVWRSRMDDGIFSPLLQLHKSQHRWTIMSTVLSRKNPAYCFSSFKTNRLVTSSIEATSEWLYDWSSASSARCANWRDTSPFRSFHWLPYELYMFQSINHGAIDSLCERMTLAKTLIRLRSTTLERATTITRCNGDLKKTSTCFEWFKRALNDSR